MIALVIRTLYNNQDWKDRCKQPYIDKLCYYCPDNKLGLKITPPSPGSNPCNGSCWEQILCKQHFWGCTPKGCFWGGRAQPGIKVFFVFREHHKNKPRPTLYTLWGKTTINSIDASIDLSGVSGKHGYHLIHFAPFQPAAQTNWISGLAANNIVGKPFGSGNFRYIPNSITDELDKMIR